MPSPHDIAEDDNIIIKERDKTEVQSKGSKEDEVVRPDAPSGLVGVFTGKTIVLSWDEVKEQGVRTYNIYRAENEGYKKLGDTVIPAFIDEDIKKKTGYRYKITAVGKSESEFSNEIEIITEDK